MSIIDTAAGFVNSFSQILHTQRTYNWDLIFPDIWGVPLSGSVISKYCQSVNFGQYNMDEISEMKMAAFKEFFAGTFNIAPVTTNIITPVPDLVSTYFNSWKNKIISSEGHYYPANNYKKRLFIILYDRTGIPVNFITLEGVFPKTFPSYKLSYGDENLHKFDIEFSVDKALPGFMNTALKKVGGIAEKALNGATSTIENLF